MMKLNTLFMLNFILALVFGVGLIFAPTALTSLYDAEITAAGAFMGQLFGACLVGFAILSWLARDISDFKSRQALAMMFFLGYLLALVLSLIAQFNQVVGALGWANVAAYALLGFGFGYFRFTKKE